jgi:hypothetical protein
MRTYVLWFEYIVKSATAGVNLASDAVTCRAMKKSNVSPDEYIASLPDGIREDLEVLDREISEAMAGQERVLWEGVFWGGSEQRIIGYGSYQYVGRSGASGEWFIVGLARQKAYFSLYVNAAGGDGYLLRGYANRLGKVKVGSANVTFKRLADLDLDALRQLLQEARATTVADPGGASG